MGIKGFLETSFVDWPGRMAAVVFLGGCNFRCPFCHNGELLRGEAGIPDLPPEAVLGRMRSLRGWVDAVVVSGGEPTVDRGLAALLEDFRSAALDVKLDTNGSRPEAVAALLREGLVQRIDMDLKAPLRRGPYSRLAGVPVDPAVIEESVGIVAASGVPHRFRTTYVPGLLGREEILEIRESLPPSSPFVIQPFDPRRTLDPRLRETPKPAPDELRGLRAMVAARAAA